MKSFGTGQFLVRGTFYATPAHDISHFLVKIGADARLGNIPLPIIFRGCKREGFREWLITSRGQSGILGRIVACPLPAEFVCAKEGPDWTPQASLELAVAIFRSAPEFVMIAVMVEAVFEVERSALMGILVVESAHAGSYVLGCMRIRRMNNSTSSLSFMQFPMPYGSGFPGLRRRNSPFDGGELLTEKHLLVREMHIDGGTS